MDGTLTCRALDASAGQLSVAFESLIAVRTSEFERAHSESLGGAKRPIHFLLPNNFVVMTRFLEHFHYLRRRAFAKLRTSSSTDAESATVSAISARNSSR